MAESINPAPRQVGASEDQHHGPRPSWARGLADGYMCLGAALPTRDGRRTGNATLVSVNPDGTAKVLTDAGNRMVLTHRELEELFHEPVWTMDPNDAPGYAGDLNL